MAARVCTECTTVYAVGALRCPHCSSAQSVEQGEPMPKITRHGGPTNAGAAATTPAAAAPAPDHQGEHGPELVHFEGGEQPSAGTSSSTSSEKPPTNSEQSEAAAPKRARTTASRSKKTRTDDSAAPSTDGAATASDD